MKKYIHFILTSFITLNLGLASCNKTAEEDKLCTSFTSAPVVKVEGAKTAAVNQTIALIVSFPCFSSCGNFGNYQQTVTGNTTIINVMAKYQGCICTQDVPTRQSIYNFSASQPGIYYLKFLQTANAYLIDTITVQ
ncbi:hypothetical protein [Ferruginibacter sp.]|nr:hypothetical protein [Ferruginibacter sp.]